MDERRLGPAFRFFHRHRTLSETGRVLGYEGLAELRRALEPVLLRRTRTSVRQDLPMRTTELVRVTPTEQQLAHHRGFMQTVAAVLRKRYVIEMDLLRLRKALLGCRLAADSTALVDKQLPGQSSKLERLEELLPQLLREEGRKIVLFSEWTSMLDLVEARLHSWKARFVRLDGTVPQRKCQALVDAFSADASCSLFLTTNAGSTGLNLQAADTVVNVDLPWNPALLEQRISRVHRMGQTRPVQVFVLISEGTLEEQLLGTLAAKQELAQAVLNPDSEVDAVDLTSNVEELRARLEVLLGARPEAALHQREPADHEREFEARRERIATAGGALVGAAFSFLSELLPAESTRPGADHLSDLVRKQLAECLEEDAAGRPRLTVVLPDRSALDALARSLGHLLAERSST